MSIIINIAGQPEKKAYIGWTPEGCIIGLSAPQLKDVKVTLRNKGSIAAKPSVWFYKTQFGARLTTLPLILPKNGAPVPFFIGGRIASSADQDIAIEAVGSLNVVLGNHTVMVRIRKDANNLSVAERDRFLHAYQTLNQRTSLPTYQAFLDMHNAAANTEIHTTSPTTTRTSFLPWHRAYILDIERQLQSIDPSVTLPYWKFDAPAPNVFTQDFMGDASANGTVNFSASNPLLHWSVSGAPALIRKPLFVTATAPANVSNDTATLGLGHQFLPFADMENDPHGAAHVSFTQPASPISKPPTAPRDPLFFLLHCNVDRIWALWQTTNTRYDIHNNDTYTPQGSFGSGGTHAIGDFLNDTMWPWNGVTTGGRPSTAPGGHLPTLPWPSHPSSIPAVWEMIDYFGFFGGTGSYFDYDSIHYRHTLALIPPIIQKLAHKRDSLMKTQALFADDIKKADRPGLKVLLKKSIMPRANDNAAAAKILTLISDKSESLNERGNGINKIKRALFKNAEAVGQLIEILQDKTEPATLRLAIIEMLVSVSFSNPAFTSNLPRFKQALKQLINDKDIPLQQRAIELLAGYNDEQAQKILLDGLNDPSKARMPKEKAIQLLALDPKSGFEIATRKFLDAAETPEVQREAVNALASDAGSQEQIKKLFTDKKTDKQVRIAAMVALNAFDPKQFQGTLKKSIMDPGEHPDIKVASLSALSFHDNLPGVMEDKEFSKTIDSLASGKDKHLKMLSEKIVSKSTGKQ